MAINVLTLIQIVMIIPIICINNGTTSEHIV